MKVILFSVIVAIALLAGCVSQQEGNTIIDGNTIRASYGTEPAKAVEQNKTAVQNTSAKQNESEVVTMAKNPIVVFETDKGTFEAEIFVKEAPITGNNFMQLVKSKFYDGLTFHRVEPNFVVQGGDPNGDGTGGADKTIALEIKPNLKHVVGSLGMARSQSPNSASSQFYVVTGEASFLDGQYAVFGKVLGNGMSVVNEIEIGDKMNKVYEKK
ncbi:MAG: peptidylprolyl isomerase [Candidatus Micrarchaeia archaeon]